MYSVQDTLAGGFPHSEIHGSKSVRNSPWLIAAYDVLHRLSAPRHPPNALTTLDRSHYRYPPARQQTGSLEKTSFLRGRARSQAVKTANLATCRPLAGAIRTDLLFTMSDNTCPSRRSGNDTNSCFSTDARLNTTNFVSGGARRDRTDDLLLAKQALSQLSYGPGPGHSLTAPTRGWWAREDLNFRPHAYQACALTT